jgi:hypothetical protein
MGLFPWNLPSGSLIAVELRHYKNTFLQQIRQLNYLTASLRISINTQIDKLTKI